MHDETVPNGSDPIEEDKTVLREPEPISYIRDIAIARDLADVEIPYREFADSIIKTDKNRGDIARYYIDLGRLAVHRKAYDYYRKVARLSPQQI